MQHIQKPMPESPPCSLRRLLLPCLPFLLLHLCKWRLSSASDLFICGANITYRIECYPGERIEIEYSMIGRHANDTVNCLKNEPFDIEKGCGINATVQTSSFCNVSACSIEFNQTDWDKLVKLQSTSVLSKVCPSEVPVYNYFRYDCYLINGFEKNMNDTVATGRARTLLRTSTLFAMLPGLCISALFAGILG